MSRPVFTSPDGTEWTVEVSMPGSSNAMVIFHHPAAGSSSNNRYAWYITRGPEARSVTTRLAPAQVLKQLNGRELGKLFRRSMKVSAGANRGLLAG